jgi:CRP/FNR family nitrogen fixation transcriptional regulator
MYVTNASTIAADRRLPAIAHSGQLDALIALERFGTRHVFKRNEEVFAEGDGAEHWYKVVAGTVRTCRVLMDGRRHVGAFHYAGDFFGTEAPASRAMSAEAIDDVVVMRYPRKAIERVAEEDPALARRIREMAYESLAAAQDRMLLLGRKTAPERVASFLLDLAERADRQRRIELPMTRYDIADFLGLTIETVSRVLSSFKRAGTIGLPSIHLFDLLDRATLEEAAGLA